MLPALSTEEDQRYARQMAPALFGHAGQQRLKAASVLVTRIGGVGGPAALTLLTAGVGKLIVAHAGTLESPDLNRQLLGTEAGLGYSRVEQFAATLRAHNSFGRVEAIDHEPNDAEARDWAHEVDLIVSCAADFPQRLRLSRAAHQAGIPFIDAAQWGMTGSLLVSNGRSTPCLDCLYPEVPPFEADFPVSGAIAAVMGNLAAMEALKILSGVGSPLFGRLLVVEGLKGEIRNIRLQRRATCSICGAAEPHLGNKNYERENNARRPGIRPRLDQFLGARTGTGGNG